MAGRVARARLRQGKDDDIRAALDQAIRKQDESDIIREALRLYFGLEKQERVPIQRLRSIGRPVHPVPSIVTKPELVPMDNEDISQDTNTALDNLLGF